MLDSKEVVIRRVLFLCFEMKVVRKCLRLDVLRIVQTFENFFFLFFFLTSNFQNVARILKITGRSRFSS